MYVYVVLKGIHSTFSHQTVQIDEGKFHRFLTKECISCALSSQKEIYFSIRDFVIGRIFENKQFVLIFHENSFSTLVLPCFTFLWSKINRVLPTLRKTLIQNIKNFLYCLSLNCKNI